MAELAAHQPKGAGAGAEGGAAPKSAKPEAEPTKWSMPTLISEEKEEQLDGTTPSLFVGNLPMDITKKALVKIFGEFRKFEKVDLPIKYRRPCGFAIVHFEMPDDAADCLNEIRANGGLFIPGKRVAGQPTEIAMSFYCKKEKEKKEKEEE